MHECFRYDESPHSTSSTHYVLVKSKPKPEFEDQIKPILYNELFEGNAHES